MTPEQIKHALKKKGLRQRDLVKRFAVSPTAISFLLNGKFTSPRLEKKLARALGVTLVELRDKTDAMVMDEFIDGGHGRDSV